MKYTNCKTVVLILSASTMLALSGCGSDGTPSDSGFGVVDKVNTGYFTDSAVEGLTYTTASQSGATDASGAFKYKDGETITFSIGDVIIGETVSAKSDMTPFDLVPDAVLYTTTSEVTKMYRSSWNSPARKAFSKLHNILTFLQSLDDDSNPSNGIVIPDGISTLLTGIGIDFEERFEKFENYAPLRVITNKAANMGLLNSGAIPKMGVALDHFYQSQGINLNLGVSGIISQDSGADGNPDSITTYTYDVNGNQLTSIYDSGADGTPDSIITSTYDANSNQLTDSYDNDADGTPESITTRTFDANGNQLTYSYDYVSLPESISTYTYDAYGNQLTYIYDYNADGTPDSIYTYTYDANGNQLTDSYDNDADGTPDSISTYTFDANSNRLTFSNDIDADGTPDSIGTYTYDANGNQLTYIYDYNADGTPDSIYTYTYDANGNQLTDSYASDADGTPESITTRTYDAYGNQLTSSYDNDANGTPESIYAYTPINATWRALLYWIYD